MAPGLVVLRKGEELTLCPDCEQPVKPDGRTLVLRLTDGRPGMKVIRIAHGPAWSWDDERAPLAPPRAEVYATMRGPPERRVAID